VFTDGASPPHDIISRFLDLVESTFLEKQSAADCCIAVHCVAGLGRYAQFSPIITILCFQ
jgi:protein-tyrosine phosphatase